MNCQLSNNTEKLRELYLEVRSKKIPSRIKGVNFLYIALPLGILGFLLTVYELFYFTSIHVSEQIYSIIAFILIWLFMIFPEEFYSERKRLPRKIYPQYPKIEPMLKSLEQPGTREVHSTNVPELDINGDIYFLVGFVIRQKWWELQETVELTGYVLLNSNCEIVQSRDLFLQAYQVLLHGGSGNLGMQRHDYDNKQQYKWMKNKTIPGAIKLIREQKSHFENSRMAETWRDLNSRLDILAEAISEGYKYIEDKDKICNAIGYSFGTRFYLEDAMIEDEIHHIFSKYMNDAYVSELNYINKTAKELQDGIKNNLIWFRKFAVLNALMQIRKAIMMIAYNIVQASQTGIPHHFEWKGYVDRLKFARQLGLPIIEIGEFSEEYPVERITEMFPYYEPEKK